MLLPIHRYPPVTVLARFSPIDFDESVNALVVTVFLSIKKLGVSGALSVSTGALGVAAASMLALKRLAGKEESKSADA